MNPKKNVQIRVMVAIKIFPANKTTTADVTNVTITTMAPMTLVFGRASNIPPRNCAGCATGWVMVLEKV